MGSRLLRGLCWNSTRWEVGVGLEFRRLAARMVPSVFIALRGMPLVTTNRANVVADEEVPERRGLSGGLARCDSGRMSPEEETPGSCEVRRSTCQRLSPIQTQCTRE